MMPLAKPASCFNTVRRLICLLLPVNSDSPEKSGLSFSQQSIVSSSDRANFRYANACRSREVLYSGEVIKIQQGHEKTTNKTLNSLASNDAIITSLP